MLRSPFDGLRMPAELACEFFGLFGRFEYTLKELGMVQPSKPRAEPDWHEFARQTAGSLDAPAGSPAAAAIGFLVANPPQIQTRMQGWQAKPLIGDTDIARAIDAACRVRHNLFHGGKHTMHSPDGHDQNLVEAARTVLTACLEQREDLRYAFEQRDC